jgi:hypothetical protein
MATVTIRGLDAATFGLLSDNTALEAEDDSGASVYITIGMIRTLLFTGPTALSFSGDVTGSGSTSLTLTIAAGAVTLAKMASIATATILGRSSAGTGAPEVLTLGAGLGVSGGVLDTVTSLAVADGLALFDHRAFGGF